MKPSSYNYKCSSLGQISELEQKGVPEQKIKADKNIENPHAVQLQAGKTAVFQDIIHLGTEMSVHLRVKAGAVVFYGDQPLSGINVALNADMPGGAVFDTNFTEFSIRSWIHSLGIFSSSRSSSISNS